jgi:aminomethyltransferase
LYGNDINDTTSPLKLVWDGLRSSLIYQSRKPEKQKEKLELLKISRFEMQERAVRHDYEIVDGTGTVIGVTSGTMSPSMNKGIGMGYAVENSALESDILSESVK